MVAKSGLTWKTSPIKRIGIPIRDRVALVPVVVFAVGQTGAQQWKSEAQLVREWVDRTNAARAGLTGEAHMEGQNTVIQVFSSVEYGIYLETGTEFMDAYESILPAMNTTVPLIVANAQKAVISLMAGGR